MVCGVVQPWTVKQPALLCRIGPARWAEHAAVCSRERGHVRMCALIICSLSAGLKDPAWAAWDIHAKHTERLSQASAIAEPSLCPWMSTLTSGTLSFDIDSDIPR